MDTHLPEHVRDNRLFWDGMAADWVASGVGQEVALGAAMEAG